LIGTHHFSKQKINSIIGESYIGGISINILDEGPREFVIAWGDDVVCDVGVKNYAAIGIIAGVPGDGGGGGVTLIIENKSAVVIAIKHEAEGDEAGVLDLNG
jgi:hypothetical protein